MKTKDWLLAKLFEVSAERDRLQSNINTTLEELRRMAEENNKLTDRIRDMTPQKQYRVFFKSSQGESMNKPMTIISAASFNGVTDLTVQLP